MRAAREQRRLPILLIATIAAFILLVPAPVTSAATVCDASAEQCLLQSRTRAGKRKAYGKRLHTRPRPRIYEAPPPPLSAPRYEFRQSPSYGCTIFGCD
jgi:hypothetical protein